MTLPYDPARDDTGVPSDTSRPAPSLDGHQHAATSAAVAPVTLGRIRPIEIQEYSDKEASGESHDNSTGSPHEISAEVSSTTGRDQDETPTPQEALMKEQAKLIRKWATGASRELATILEENMQSHLNREYESKEKVHREKMATMLRTELTPIISSRLYEEMRPAVKSDLRADQLPLVRQELRDEALSRFIEPLKLRAAEEVLPYKAQQLAQAEQEVEKYRQQRIEDAENASNTYYNNQCQGMDEELKGVYDDKYTQADEDLEDYRQQRMQDVEDASNTHYNNACDGMDEELQGRWEEEHKQLKADVKELREKKLNRMEDDVEIRIRRYWESERIRVNREIEEYEQSRGDEIRKDFGSAREKLNKQEQKAYSDLEKQLKATKRERRADMNIQLNNWKDARMAAIDAEIASERANRLSRIGECTEIPTPGEEHPLHNEQGTAESKSDSDNDKRSSLDAVSTGENTLVVSQVDNGPEEIKSINKDTEKARRVASNESRRSRRSGPKRAREDEEETAGSKSDSKIENESVSINQKHDDTDGSPRPIKRVRHHSSSLSSIPRPSQEEDAQQCGLKNDDAVPASFVVDTKPSGGSTPKIVPTYSRFTDAVLGAKDVVPKDLTSTQDWSCNLEAPEQEDSVGPRGTRFFEASQGVTTTIESTETAAASSTGTATASSIKTAAISSTETAATNSTDIVMSTTKNYSTTQEKIVSTPAVAAKEDEDDEL